MDGLQVGYIIGYEDTPPRCFTKLLFELGII